LSRARGAWNGRKHSIACKISRVAPGDKHGPYELISSIGEGGMGEVWKARDTRLDRIVALKFSKAAFSERFEREARAVAALNHPHICTLHDVGPNYLVMEYIEGAPLKGPLPLAKAIEYATQILDALDAAHKKNITHRDLKPANVLVTKQGVKLLDFGLARHSHGPLTDTDATLTKALTTDGQILGTLQYMSPEQLQARTADARSDIFAFGCVLYELLSGKRAFSGDTAASVIAAIMEREPAVIDVSPPLDRVIKTCLAKDPDDRFQTALDLKRNLLWAVDVRPETAKAPAKFPWLWAAAAAVVAAGLTWVAVRPAGQSNKDVYWLTISPPEGGTIDITSGVDISPDGKKVAFVASAKEGSGIWIRSLDNPTPVRLAGSEGARYPFWSPDSRSIGYHQGLNVVHARLDGSGAQAIAKGTSYFRSHWARNEAIYSTSGSTVESLDPRTGTTTKILSIDTARGDARFSQTIALPNGKILLHIRSSRQGETGVYLISLAAPGERKMLVATTATYGYADNRLLWLNGDTLVAWRLDVDRGEFVGEQETVSAMVGVESFDRLAAYPAGSNLVLIRLNTVGTRKLVWMDRSGRRINEVVQHGANQTFRPSPDGAQIASSRAVSGQTYIHLVSTKGGAWNRLTFGIASIGFPVWSPNSKYVIFQAVESQLAGKASDGSGPEELITKSANRQWPTDWSKDGGTLLYYEFDPKTQRDIRYMPVSGSGKPDPSKASVYLQTPANEYHGRFSPEARPRWILYVSDESGRDEVYVQGFPEARGKWQISSGGGRFPEWNPNGKEIFYLGADSVLRAVGVKLSDTAVTVGESAKLFALPNDVNSPYAAGPDANRFLVRVPADDQQAPLEVIINWPGLLGKKGN